MSRFALLPDSPPSPRRMTFPPVRRWFRRITSAWGLGAGDGLRAVVGAGALALVAGCAACKAEQPTAANPAPAAPGSGSGDTPAEGPAETKGDAKLLAAAAESKGDDAEGADAADAPAAPPEEAGPPPIQKVLILGDSLAATGFGVLLEKRLDADPRVKAYRRAKSASGLARPDFFDWMREGKRQVELREPDLVVVIMGGNDGQDLTPGRRKGKRVRWKTEGWDEAYRGRMDTFLGGLGAPERKVLWLGLPSMGMRSLERKLELIRSVQEEAIAALGSTARYLDTSPMFTDENGQLIERAKVGDRKRPQVIRADDGIHLTMAGSQYFADKVYPEVLTSLGLPLEPPPEPEKPEAAPAEVAKADGNVGESGAQAPAPTANAAAK